MCARKLAMKDLHLKLEKLLTEAEDCDLIGKLATDKRKRKLFEKLAADLRGMARDIEAMIALKPNGGHIREAMRPSVCCHHNRLVALGHATVAACHVHNSLSKRYVQ
jgi:hypothetical protein